MIEPAEKEILDFVEQSNAIEGIYETSGLKWENHLMAARYIIDLSLRNNLAEPLCVHEILMAGILNPEYCGAYRTVKVRVGNDIPPNPAIVHRLMDEYNIHAADFVNAAPTNEKDMALEAMNLHCWFEAIHPFIDGNGRTGRLLLNNIRLLKGLKLLTIREDEKYEYYDQIAEYKRKHKGW